MGEKPKQKPDVEKLLAENAELTGLAASLGAMATGAALMVDDYADFGKDGTERDPPIPHHYMYGAIMLLGGLFGVCMSGLAFLKKVLPPPEGEKPPESFVKQAVPLEDVERKLLK
jgi:H+/Cl- antiporter ClcA